MTPQRLARSQRSRRADKSRLVVFIVAVVLLALACARADVPVDYGNVTPINQTTPAWLQGDPTGPPTATLPPASPPVAGVPVATARFTQDTSNTPTPDATRPSSVQRTAVEAYSVARGDSLNAIASRYGVSPAQIAAAGTICPVRGGPIVGVDRLNNVVAPGRAPIPANAVINISNIQALTGLSPDQSLASAAAAIGQPSGYFVWG